MSFLMELDEIALREFESALEGFKQSVESRCNTLEGGIDGCSKFMKDESSQKALNEGKATCDRIRSCLQTTDRLLELVRRTIRQMDNAPGM